MESQKLNSCKISIKINCTKNAPKNIKVDQNKALDLKFPFFTAKILLFSTSRILNSGPYIIVEVDNKNFITNL